MNSPKFYPGQPVLIYPTPQTVVPDTGHVMEVLGYWHKGDHVHVGGHCLDVGQTGWFYWTETCVCHEECLKPIIDPDAETPETQEEIEKTV